MSAIVATDAGLCADGGVAEVGIRPGFGGIVASVARQAGHDVAVPLAGGLYAVMAVGAASRDFVVIHTYHGPEDGCRVARVALVCGQWMACTFQVTTGATAGDFSMIDANRRAECTDGMTGSAVIGSVDVREILSDGAGIVMACHACAENFRMIDPQHGLPPQDRVAGVAAIGRRNVRTILAGRG